jgi:hypothetical protein
MNLRAVCLSASQGSVTDGWRPQITAINRIRRKERFTVNVCSFLMILDDWLTVHHSITFYHQLDAQNSCLFTYNTVIKIRYMFRALPCSSSGGLRRKGIYMQSLVSSLSAGDCLVHRLRKNCYFVLSSVHLLVRMEQTGSHETDFR